MKKQIKIGKCLYKNKCLITIFITLIFATLLCGIFNFYKNNETYALSSMDSTKGEIALQATGTLSSIDVEVDYTKTNAYGVSGIFTSMTPQDLITYNYLTVTAYYDSGETKLWIQVILFLWQMNIFQLEM